MTRELRNAVSRLQKLQRAAINGNIDSYKCVLMQMTFYCHHYDDGDTYCVNVAISVEDDNLNRKRLHWQMDDDGCETIGLNDKDNMTHNEFLQYVAQFVDYPV